MNMRPDQENFDALRRLLVIKRYEQPPPGYFEGFSHQVLVGIRQGGQAPESFTERLFEEAGWLQRIWAALEGRPILAGAMGFAVCGLLAVGVLNSEKPYSDGAQALNPNPLAIISPDHASLAGFSSTNGFLPSQNRGSLFEEFQRAHGRPEVVPVSALAAPNSR
jgi:hypothetical protein